MILLIDNYDSFSYNLYQLIGGVEADIKVVRNDECTLEEIAEMKPEAIILSPGPGRPEDAGICITVIKEFAGKIPILGVCLGHQSICEAFGGTVSYAKELMTGYFCSSQISFTGSVKRYTAGGTESNRRVRGRRGYGGGTYEISGFRSAVSSGICYDTGWQSDDREFHGGSEK